MTTHEEVTSLADGEVVFWIEQGSSIHIKAISPYGDPVELTAAEARRLAEHLLRMAALIG